MKKLPLAALMALACASLCGPALAQTATGYRNTVNNQVVTIPDTPTTPHPVTSSFVASGLSAVTAALTSATCSSAFTPIAGRGFNVSIDGTFVASVELKRSFDGGTTKRSITAAATPIYQWTGPVSETAQEDEFGVAYYVCVTSYTSGTVNVRISQ